MNHIKVRERKKERNKNKNEKINKFPFIVRNLSFDQWITMTSR
jgi:hypothetical protein